MFATYLLHTDLKMSTWTSRNSGKSSGRYYVFAGRAYGRVKRGTNATTMISSDRGDRERFYRDPAVVLSDADMEAFNGTEGSPLCVEHNPSDVVGVVHHSWLGNGDDRSLKIIGRISLDTPRGRAVAEEVRAGRYKGLSVGYSAEIDGNDKLHEKRFREISLVVDPFFSDCQLASYGVMASKGATKNVHDNSNHTSMQLQIQASRIVGGGMSSDQLAAAGSTSSPAGGVATNAPAVTAEELLGQTDQLKTHLAEERKQREAAMQREKEKDDLLAYYKAKEADEAAAYAKAQAPKAEAYIATMTASRNGGQPMPEKMAQGYRETFCMPQFKEAAAELEQQGKFTAELMASKKSAEERAAAAEAQAKSYQSAVSKTSEILNHSRADFAAALQPKDATEDAERRKTVEDVTASASAGLRLNQIMMPTPSAAELGFLKHYGYVSSSSVNASALAPGERFMPRSVPIAASHRNQTDHDGNTRFEQSWRKTNPPQFSWMCDMQELRSDGGDISDVVTLNASRELYLRKAADPLSVGGGGGGGGGTNQ